ncbi:hypothetical protein N7541_009393 [Penicillium brevicompactum]|uniref:Uncharacterized protein n=1 Tax=Penicillium brevicompactum TaxID=5074 RepID=A0A9W9QP06_PENBR|nr:hypothetical protein N7541_009393 [Penicillium brevicompactum]
MADPHAGGLSGPPINTQETTDGFTEEDLATRTTVEDRKRTRSGDAVGSSGPAVRITTKEVWKLIGTLKDVIHHQTAIIAATQQEPQEVKHNQHFLQEQKEKLHDEVKALRTQIETNPPATATKPSICLQSTGPMNAINLYNFYEAVVDNFDV